MAAKLGLAQPINRESEEDPLAAALRQLIEHNRRQSVFIERLAALTPQSKTPTSSQTRKKLTNPQTRTPQTTMNSQTRTSANPRVRTSTNSQTGTHQTMSNPDDSAPLNPAKQATNDMNGSMSVKHLEPNDSNNTLVERFSIRFPSALSAQNPNKPLHLSKEQYPTHHIVSYVPPSLPLPVRLPIQAPGFHPHFVDPQSILAQRYPFSAPYHNPINAKTIFPEHRIQYPVNLHFPDVMQRYLYPVNYQPAAVPPTVPVEHKAPLPEIFHLPDLTQRYLYPASSQPAPTASSLTPRYTAQRQEKPHIPGSMKGNPPPVNSQPAPVASSVSRDLSWQYPYTPEDNLRQNYVYRIRPAVEQ